MIYIRKVVFQNEYYYHIFNRGLDRRVVFGDKNEYRRMINLLEFYQYRRIPLRYSRYKEINSDMRQMYREIMVQSGKRIEIIAYCLMPNHFHLILKQIRNQGIISYMSDILNAYTKYYNTRHKRVGRLFQGRFGAVFIESDEHLLHETRYVHINPVVASLIPIERFENYLWSSYLAYANNIQDVLVEPMTIQMVNSLVPDYKKFVMDQIAYGKELKRLQRDECE